MTKKHSHTFTMVHFHKGVAYIDCGSFFNGWNGSSMLVAAKINTNALGCKKTKQVSTSNREYHIENTVACHQTHTEDSTPEFPRSPEQRQV